MGMKRMGKKKEYRCTPTLLTLKSNTMKNTETKVRTLIESARKTRKKVCFITLFRVTVHIINKSRLFFLSNFILFQHSIITDVTTIRRSQIDRAIGN
jgi:hypothetical protein